MKHHVRRQIRFIIILAAIAALLCLMPVPVLANATDEILDFTITVDVNDDASLNMAYHIDWLVLDDSIGKLEWIDLGVPNEHHVEIVPQSTSIDHIEDNGSSLAIYLDRAYGEGETVSIDFSMTQDYMYQIDKWNEGETAYTFTPAWFDSMDVDDLNIRWNAQNAVSWQPDCLQDQGYLVFNTSLSSGSKYTISVTYPNDTFGFVSERQASNASSGGGGGESDDTLANTIAIIVSMLSMLLLMFGVPIYLLVRFISWITAGTGFGSKAVKKKITRTKIEYYAKCPNCGAVREEGKEKCDFCGCSMIKSKVVVKEDQIKEPEKYAKNGTFRYGSSPNTYIHVNVVNVPAPRSRSSSSSVRSGSSHRSSCACACASSCACACACASSGRAGCSVKDFFKISIHEGRVRVRKE